MNWRGIVLTLLLSTAIALMGCDRPHDEDVDDEAWRAVAERYDCDPENGGITLPNDFCAFVVIDSLGPARHLVVRNNGDLYVAIRSRPNAPGSVAALRDEDGDGRADVVRRFGPFGGTGIDIHDGYLYFASDTSVIRYRLEADSLVPPGEPETVITGLIDQRSHASKTFAFDDAGHLYLNIGAPSNACQESARTPGSPGLDPCPQLERQGGIWRFDANRTMQTQDADGYRYATGIRNAMGIAWKSDAGALFATQHGRDQLKALWGEEMYSEERSADLPAEEFFRVDEGDNFGWPYCYFDQFLNERVRAPEYGGDGQSTEGCETYERPLVAFPGHMAPNDLTFIEGNQFPAPFRGGALIAFHGSWNRHDARGQQGYVVAFVPMQGSEVTGDWEVFADGFAGAETLTSPGEARHRPTGLAMGPDGTLYISDSVKGRIWRVLYTGPVENLAGGG